MKIEMPKEEEIRHEIDNIIAKSIKEKESFYSYLKNMYKQIGFKYLFHDGMEIVFTILLVFIILISAIRSSSIRYMENAGLIYVYLFTASPILYLAMSIYSFIHVKQNKTYEIEMTCKYDLYQIAAFRMLMFSIICIVFNFLFIFMVSYFYKNLNFIKAFMISITSLFLFSSIFLYTIMKLKNKLAKYTVIFGWIGFNTALCMFKVNYYIDLLNNISTYTWTIVALGSIFIYLKNLKEFTLLRCRKGMI